MEVFMRKEIQQFGNVGATRRSLSRMPSILIVAFLLMAALASAMFAQMADPGLFWRQEVTIKRVVKTYRPKPEQIKARLLTIRWQLLTLTKEKVDQPVDSRGHSFANGDKFRAAVQINQPGHVYALKHTQDRNGKRSPYYLISRDDKFSQDNVIELPLKESAKQLDSDKAWWKVSTRDKREFITMIFSRDRIEELVNTGQKSEQGIQVDEKLVAELTRQSSVPKQGVWSLKSQRKTSLQGIRGEHVVMAWNPDRNNNEVLVEIIEIKRNAN